MGLDQTGRSDYEPSASLNLANVALNGAPAGSVQPDGTAFYRDVAPGHYHITVESAGADVNQAKYVDLAPSQEAFVKILALSSGESGGEQSHTTATRFTCRWCRHWSRALRSPTTDA